MPRPPAQCTSKQNGLCRHAVIVSSAIAYFTTILLIEVALCCVVLKSLSFLINKLTFLQTDERNTNCADAEGENEEI